MKCDCGAPCEREILVYPSIALDGILAIEVTGTDSCGKFASADIKLSLESSDQLIDEIRKAQAMVRYLKQVLVNQENESSVRMLHEIKSKTEIIQACDQHKQEIDALIREMQEEASKE